MTSTIRLGVNVDHVATLRQARGDSHPDVLTAAKEAMAAGADSITVHLREDRRHIQDHDVVCLNDHVPVNLEIAATEEMIEIARSIQPEWCCIVPEKREELTTEGGLDIESLIPTIQNAVEQLKSKDINVSLFVDARVSAIQAAHRCKADAVEIHTGILDTEPEGSIARQSFLHHLKMTSEWGHQNGLRIHAGHGLNYQNVTNILDYPAIQEVNIGHSIVSRSIFVGLYRAVSEMKQLLQK